jgi:hypothetical protein
MSATPAQTSSYEGKSIMAAKKKTPTNPAAGLQTLRIGSRVRCTDDGAEGRIVWAGPQAVKIQWNDGEHVTWKRAELAGKPITILAGDEDQPAAPAAAPEPAEFPAPETPPAAPETAAEPTAPEASPAAPEAAQEPPAVAPPASEPTAVETLPPAAEPAQEKAPTEMPGSANERKRRRAQKAASATAKKDADDGKQKKLSALDAAAKVLGETGAPMTCPEMIGAMAAQGYWTSPGGKTPHATLYSAIAREIATKGDQARFTKADRGTFARRGA